MENKYYTPSIEEFHVGYEFEIKSNRADSYCRREDENEYTKVVFHPSDVPFAIQQDILQGNIRCKILDRQDIEELGWEYSETYSENDIFTKKVAIVRGEYEAILHHVEFTKWVMIYLKNETESHTVFAGHIRNKSQLRQLMSWLNIE